MKIATIDEQISFLLKQMENAMPEVRRQVKVYEKNIKSGKVVKSTQIATQFKYG